jgi:hypothetical protein
VLKRGVLANLAVASFAHLVQVIWHGLKKIQYQPVSSKAALPEPGSPWNANTQRTSPIKDRVARKHGAGRREHRPLAASVR